MIKLLKYILIIVFILPKMLFSQTNMKEAYFFITKIDTLKPVKRFLRIDIKKGKEYLQYKEIKYVLFYKDSLKIINFRETKKGEINRTKKTIKHKNIIYKTNLFFDKFDRFKSKCVHRTPLGSHVYTKKTKFIKYSNNEWLITGAEIKEGDKDYSYKFSSRVKLSRIDCLGFFKNLKSRKMVRELVKQLE